MISGQKILTDFLNESCANVREVALKINLILKYFKELIHQDYIFTKYSGARYYLPRYLHTLCLRHVYGLLSVK